MLAILCPGQGAQHREMFDLLSTLPAARAALDEASAAAGYDVVAAARDAPDIFSNSLAQPLLCACAVAAWRALAPHLPAPRLFAGYSVGELAAHGCAGTLTIGETVRLAGRRAALMSAASACAAGLLAVRGLAVRRVEVLCNACGAEVAIVNGEDHVVCGGPEAALAALAAEAAAQGGSAQRLPIAVPAHTRWLAAAVPRFKEALDGSSISAPAVPVVAGFSAGLVRDRTAAIEALSRQIAQTVQWAHCLDTLHEHGCRVFLELGPGNGLTRMAQERFSDTRARSLIDFRGIAGAAAWVGRSL